MALRAFASRAAAGYGLRASIRSSVAPAASALAREFSTVVDGLKYAKSHEYVKLDGEIATVGITDFAQAELGDLVYVELPEVGQTLEAGEALGVVESVKAASDIYSPVSGEVVEINEALIEDPSKVNSEPFEGGWLAKIKVTGGLDDLLDAAAYTAFCESEAH